jgi:lipoprotein-anchoring transpeptidase ErfK/SrfK
MEVWSYALGGSTLKTFSRGAFANPNAARLDTKVSAIVLGILLWYPMLLWAMPPTAAAGIELQDDLLDGWINEDLVSADSAHQVFRLMARDYAQGQTYPVTVIWQTTTGEPLPPLHLQVTTPPPLSVAVNTEGLANLGLVLPLRLTFSEPLAEKEKTFQQVTVKTGDVQDVPGTWRWVGKRSLQFTPQPAWPASSVIEVSVDATSLRTLQGGRMEQSFLSSFSTGTDRKVFVYLATQQVTAVEKGKLLRTFRVSTGKGKTPTTEGSFYIYDRYRHKTMRSKELRKGQPGYYLIEDVPYTQFFDGGMALHGAFWHNKFGRPVSHGCVNLSTRDMNKRWPNAVEDAGWLYSWASLGVPVRVLKDNPEKMGSRKREAEDLAVPISRFASENEDRMLDVDAHSDRIR